LPSSRYCGLESHQALAGIDSDNVSDLAAVVSAEDGAVAQDTAETAVDEPASPLEAEEANEELAAAVEADVGAEELTVEAEPQAAAPDGDTPEQPHDGGLPAPEQVSQGAPGEQPA
jgi:hypothetical protein